MQQQFKVEAQQQIGRLVGRTQGIQRSNRSLHKIDGTVGSKGEHQVGGHLRQYRQKRCAIAHASSEYRGGGRRLATSTAAASPGYPARSASTDFMALLVALRAAAQRHSFCRKTVGSIHRLPKCRAFDEQPFGQPAPMLQVRKRGHGNPPLSAAASSACTNVAASGSSGPLLTA
jgi:hypothetical protein